MKKRRFEDEECHIPIKILHKYSSDEQGCMRIAFSPNGKFLACACTKANSHTVIKIFDVEKEDEKNPCFTFMGHKNIIHDLGWLKFIKI